MDTFTIADALGLLGTIFIVLGLLSVIVAGIGMGVAADNEVELPRWTKILLWVGLFVVSLAVITWTSALFTGVAEGVDGSYG